MIYAQSVELSFDAGHCVLQDEACSTPHGHHWVCVVTISTGGSPAEQVAVTELRKRLDEIGRQLNRRDLNRMLPGTITNTTGVANWLWNELALHVPLIEVRVSADGASSVVRK
jgi:6-pyruvoyl-tetrahydropterin synthase